MNTLRQNEQIVEVMDSLLDRSKTNAQFLQTEDDLDELCFVMKSKCAIMGTLGPMWSTLWPLKKLKKKFKSNNEEKKKENTEVTDLE